MKTILKVVWLLTLLGTATFAQTKPVASVAARTKTLNSAISKAGDDAFRLALAGYQPAPNPLSTVLSVSASAPTAGKWPSMQGQYICLVAGKNDEMNAPGLTADKSAFRFGTGRSLQSSLPVSLSAFTAEVMLRRTGMAPTIQTGLHRLFSMGPDFTVSWDETRNSIIVFYPDQNVGNAGFLVQFFKDLPSIDVFQPVKIAYDGARLTLVYGGKTYTETVQGGPLSTDVFRLAADANGFGATIEVKSVSVFNAYRPN